MKRCHAGPALLCLALWAASALPQDAGPKISHHDVNGQGCASCHVPRIASPPQVRRTCDPALLWDCDLLARTFQTYDLPLANHNNGAGTAPVDDTEVRMSSILCASCHDGIGTPSMSRTPGRIGHGASSAARGFETEHPINVPHDPVKDPTLAEPASVARLVKLFGRSNNVQCSSCHDPHESANPKFLRMPNHDSELCLTCHL